MDQREAGRLPLLVGLAVAALGGGPDWGRSGGPAACRVISAGKPGTNARVYVPLASMLVASVIGSVILARLRRS